MTRAVVVIAVVSFVAVELFAACAREARPNVEQAALDRKRADRIRADEAAAQARPTVGGPSPVASAIPPGDGWFCEKPRDEASPESCWRKESDCYNFARAIECTKHARAWCFTWRYSNLDQTHSSCFRNVSRCEGILIGDRGSVHKRDVSACAEIGAGTIVVATGLPQQAADKDGDGSLDSVDQCPDMPEDKDGFEDSDGCPDNDNDKDGLVDRVDKCPVEPEDLDGFEDNDGCYDRDNDRDGIADVADKCRDQPETKNGFQDDDGCPDEALTDKQKHDKAVAHFKQAEAFFNAKAYSDAVAAYDAGLAFEAWPPALYNIGEALRLDGKRSKAIDAYQRYIEAAPKGPRVADARRYIAELTKEIRDGKSP